MSAVRAHLTALLAALLVALPAGAVARNSYFCNMMGRVMASCCCAPAAQHQAKTPCASPEIERQDCCRVIEDESRGTPALRDGASRVPLASTALAPELDALSIPSPPRTIHIEKLLARPPPRGGPPIFLANCTLLT